MTPQDFIRQIRSSVVEENLFLYKDIFTSTDPQTATDPYWKRALALYGKLDSEDKNVMFDIVRQVMVDTISNVFAVLDGVSQLDGQVCEFSLTSNSGSQRINGELQDRFLELEENR
jgi:hypothetical protein